MLVKVHTSTRFKKSVDNLHNAGVSVTYPRLRSVENSLGNAVCCLCPANLRKMVGAFNNLDDNPSSSTSSGSFHGTCISMFQFPQLDDNGTYRAPLTFKNRPEPPNYSLPDSYAIVPVTNCNISKVVVPSVKMPEKIVTLMTGKSSNMIGYKHQHSYCSRV